MHALCAASPTRWRRETARAKHIEDVKGKRVLFGGEVEYPENVNDGLNRDIERAAWSGQRECLRTRMSHPTPIAIGEPASENRPVLAPSTAKTIAMAPKVAIWKRCIAIESDASVYSTPPLSAA